VTLSLWVEELGNSLGGFSCSRALNIVLTKDRKLHRENDKVIFMSGSPKEVVAKAKSLGLENLLLIGGENTNAHFLKDGVIDEIVLSVHPLVIGKGLRLFGDDKYDTSLKLMDVRKISDELVQIRYEVVK
jgi:dihydrofolate reductase